MFRVEKKPRSIEKEFQIKSILKTFNKPARQCFHIHSTDFFCRKP